MRSATQQHVLKSVVGLDVLLQKRVRAEHAVAVGAGDGGMHRIDVPVHAQLRVHGQVTRAAVRVGMLGQAMVPDPSLVHEPHGALPADRGGEARCVRPAPLRSRKSPCTQADHAAKLGLAVPAILVSLLHMIVEGGGAPSDMPTPCHRAVDGRVHSGHVVLKGGGVQEAVPANCARGVLGSHVGRTGRPRDALHKAHLSQAATART